MLMDWLIIIGLPLMAIIPLYVIIMWIRSHRLRVRDPMKKSKYVHDYWVLEKVDKETKNLIWVNVPLLSGKIRIERPPNEVIDVGKRGRLYAEVYKLSEDEYIYIQDGGLDEYTTLEDNKKLSESYKPFTVTQRDTLVSQFKKAEAISSNRWTPERIMNIAILGVLMIIAVMGFIFAPDIIDAYSSVPTIQAEISRNNEQITRNQALLMEAMGIQIQGMNIEVTQNPSSVNGGNLVARNET